jgi:tetrahydromethanopterin S-methyltransferase subunit C
MQMNPKSVRTLMWSSIILLMGSCALSSQLAIMLMILSALCAIAPIVFGSNVVRIVGALVLIAAIGLSVSLYPDANKEMASYREHVQSR